MNMFSDTSRIHHDSLTSQQKAAIVGTDENIRSMISSEDPYSILMFSSRAWQAGFRLDDLTLVTSTTSKLQYF